MAKNTDSSIKLLVLYDILLKSTDEEHALSTNEIIEELKKRGISVSRKVLPSDIDLLNKYGYEICSYVKKSRYYYAVYQLFDTAEITMLTDVIKASKLTETRKETIINKLYSTIGIYKNADNTDNIIFLDSKKHGIQGYLPLNMDYFGKGEYFLLVASGESMINADIKDGDLVLIRKQNTFENGQI